MRRTMLVRSAMAAILTAFVGLAAAGSAMATDARASVVKAVSSDTGSHFMPLGVGKSVVIDLPRDIKDVLVADPKIANAVVRSARRAYVIGAAVGQTSLYFFDADGQQIAGFDIAVTRDLNGIRAAIKQAIPAGEIFVEGLGHEGVVLTGSVSSAAESQMAFDIAVRLLGGGSAPIAAEGSKIVNAITIRGRDQVMLRVTVAEIQRDVVKQLGINLDGNLGLGSSVIKWNTANPFSAFGTPLSDSSVTTSFKSVNSTLRAMERAGVIRTLAEPNLTAISGESATFIAGGEFPIPAGLSCDTTKSPPVCQAQIDFKKFGVTLNFTPVVLSEGRISLKVITEVSELSTDNALTLDVPGSTRTLTIPSIRTRRADTTVEIPSGGSLALAGMIQEQTKQQINGLPGLMQLPILGTLFRSRDYVNRQTELAVIITPYVVRSVAQKELSRPDDGFADASDPASMFLARLNRIYRVSGKPEPARSYHGNYGFILD
jgi:pilus assembly protein CpaC